MDIRLYNSEFKYHLYFIRFAELFDVAFLVVSVNSSIVDDCVVSSGIPREVVISDAESNHKRNFILLIYFIKFLG